MQPKHTHNYVATLLFVSMPRSMQRPASPFSFGVLDTWLLLTSAHCSSSSFFRLAGTAGPTVADLLYAPRLCWMLHENDGISPTLLDGFPKVAALVRKVYALGWVEAYYARKGLAFDSQALKMGPGKA